MRQITQADLTRNDTHCTISDRLHLEKNLQLENFVQFLQICQTYLPNYQGGILTLCDKKRQQMITSVIVIPWYYIFIVKIAFSC